MALLFRFTISSILRRGHPELRFEISVEAAKRGVAALVGASHDGMRGVFDKVAGVAEPIVVHIGVKRNAHDPFEKAGEIGIIISQHLCQRRQRAVLTEFLLHEGKDLIEQAFIVGGLYDILRRSVKLTAQGVQNPLFLHGGCIFQTVQRIQQVRIGAELVALGNLVRNLGVIGLHQSGRENAEDVAAVIRLQRVDLVGKDQKRIRWGKYEGFSVHSDSHLPFQDGDHLVALMQMRGKTKISVLFDLQIIGRTQMVVLVKHFLSESQILSINYTANCEKCQV